MRTGLLLLLVVVVVDGLLWQLRSGMMDGGSCTGHFDRSSRLSWVLFSARPPRHFFSCLLGFFFFGACGLLFDTYCPFGN